VVLLISTRGWSGEEEKRELAELQWNLETCLLEVVIARESFGKVALLHYHKADTVNHAPVLVCYLRECWV
jgi:hypothetical protein